MLYVFPCAFHFVWINKYIHGVENNKFISVFLCKVLKKLLIFEQMNSVFFLGILALHMKQVENRNKRVFEMKSAILYSGIIFGI